MYVHVCGSSWCIFQRTPTTSTRAGDITLEVIIYVWTIIHLKVKNPSKKIMISGCRETPTFKFRNKIFFDAI